MPAAGGSAFEGDFTPQKAADMLSFEDINAKLYGVKMLSLREKVKSVDYAEAFLELDGLNELLKVAARKDVSVALQGMCLKVIVELLVYENALDQVAGSQELVDRIYGLLTVEGVQLGVSKPTLEILVYLCGYVEKGYRMVLDAAEAKHSAASKPFSCLVPLLDSQDLNAVKSTLLLMNWLLRKIKEFEDDIALKQLLFKWQECGLTAVVRRVNDRALEDPDIKKGLTAFQQISNVTIPGSWEAAAKWQAKFKEASRRCDEQGEALFVYQQQQAKLRLMRLELARAQETIRALNLFAPGSSTNYHPSKRFKDGGGIPLSQLCSDNKVELDVEAAAQEISNTRRTLFEQLVGDPALRPLAEKMFGGRPARSTAGGRSRRYDPFADADDFGPPPDDDIPPPDDDVPPPDDIPPPDDAAIGPPPDDIGPPPDDDVPPPEGSPGGKVPTPARGSASARAADGAQGVPAPGGTSEVGPSPGSGPLSTSPPATAAGSAAASPPLQLGETTVASATTTSSAPAAGQIAGAASATTPASPTAVASPTGVPPPPPAPRPGGPPPPPPKFAGKSAVGAGPKKDERQFFSGPAPTKKMKPFHWDKQTLPGEPGTIWHRIHDAKEYNFGFDYEEFENMYSQKDAAPEEKKEVKKKKVLLLDGQCFQNLSILLHKLPSIPNLQRAIGELDDEALSRDSLVAIVAQIPNPDIVAQFKAQADKKPVAEYEPPEQFVSLTITVPAFRQRCTSWLFTKEYEDNVNAVMKPIVRLNDAISAIVSSRHLPYFLGLLLAFGNMMNFGNAQKGNAAAIPLATLGKLDATKDNRGKVSLMQHLFACVKKENPDALELPEELKPIMNNVANIKMEDIEKGVAECEKNLKLFVTQVAAVKKTMEKLGVSESEDAYVPRMAEFTLRAEAKLRELAEAYAACKDNFAKLLAYFGSKTLKPEEVFAELVPFVDRVRKEAAEAAKEKKRQQKKGRKIGNELGEAIGRLQESMVV